MAHCFLWPEADIQTASIDGCVRGELADIPFGKRHFRW